MVHSHTLLEQGLLGIQEQSPLHCTLLLVLLTIELHLHLEIWNTSYTQVSIHGVMNVLESHDDRLKKDPHKYSKVHTM